MRKMPKTRYDYEFDLLQAFKIGMTMGYGVDHENIRESENEMMTEFAKNYKFKTDAIDGCLWRT